MTTFKNVLVFTTSILDLFTQPQGSGLCKIKHMLAYCSYALFPSILYVKPHSHCADVATVHTDAGQPVYRDAPGHIS